jgi:uncharacterized membrane protein YphA (DoxX/SURF4 family)
MRAFLVGLTAVLALVFVVTGASKLLGVPPSPENFTRWQLSMTVMRAVGALEVLGALGLLVGRALPLAAVGLILLMLGALRTGIVFHELMHVVLPGILVGLLALLLVLQRKQARTPGR